MYLLFSWIILFTHYSIGWLFQTDLKMEIQRLNQKISRLEDRVGDVASRVSMSVPRSTSHPSNLRDPTHDEPYPSSRLARRSPVIPRRSSTEGYHSSTDALDGPPRSPLHHHSSTLSIHSPRSSNHDETRRQRKREKSRHKSGSGKTGDASPGSDSTVRGMLEDEIIEQNKDNTNKKDQHKPPPRSKSKDNLWDEPKRKKLKTKSKTESEIMI